MNKRIVILCACSLILSSCARHLTSGETTFLVSAIGSSVDYSKVKVQKGALPSVLPRTSAITINNKIYWEKQSYRDDFLPSPPDLSYLEDRVLLAHEMVHVWQKQNSDITGYTLQKVAAEHAKYEDKVYKYPTPLDLNRGFLSYRYEQQAEIVGDWIKLNELGNPEAVKYEKVIRKVMPISVTTYISSGSRLQK